MNIHKFKNYNKLLFSAWSVVAPARYGTVLYCRENSSYPSLCWKSNFFSFSKYSWKATSSCIITEVWLSHQPCSPLTCSCQCTFKMWSLSPWKLSAEPFPILTQGGYSPVSLEAAKCISQPCRSINFLAVLAPRSDCLADIKESLPMAFKESWAPPLMDNAPLPLQILHCHGNEGKEEGRENW